MTKWEYCWLTVFGEQQEVLQGDPGYAGEFWYMPPGGKRLRADEAMAELGLQGWEMVGVAPATHTPHWGEAYRMYFKRPLE